MEEIEVKPSRVERMVDQNLMEREIFMIGFLGKDFWGWNFSWVVLFLNHGRHGIARKLGLGAGVVGK